MKFLKTPRAIPTNLKRGQKVFVYKKGGKHSAVFVKKIGKNMCTIVNHRGMIETAFLFELEKQDDNHDTTTRRSYRTDQKNHSTMYYKFSF